MSRVLENFGIKLKKDLQASLVEKEREKAAKKGKSYNGNSRLYGTIKIVLDPPNDPMTASILMEDYWKYVDLGRKPGPVSAQGQRSIESWVRRKGLNPAKILADMRIKKVGKPTKLPFEKAVKQFAFVVTRKIKRKGFEASHFYSEVINDGRIDKLKIDLMEELKREVIVNVSNGNNDK